MEIPLEGCKITGRTDLERFSSKTWSLKIAFNDDNALCIALTLPPDYFKEKQLIAKIILMLFALIKIFLIAMLLMISLSLPLVSPKPGQSQ